MNKSKLMMYLHNPELLGDRDLSEVKELVDEYPCFQSARMLYVKNLRSQGYSNYGKVLRETAVFVTNRTKLFFLLDERVIIKHDAEPSQKAVEEEVFDFSKLEAAAGFKPQPSAAEKAKSELDKLIKKEMTVQPYFQNIGDTFDIDSFKQTFGKTNKTSDTQRQSPKEHQAKLLADFKGFDMKPPTVEEAKETVENNVDYAEKSSTASPDLMEKLADTFFNVGNYKQALGIYENLCLKYPEKNAYFAARIEKIKEIINN